jgi:putative transposase
MAGSASADPPPIDPAMNRYRVIEPYFKGIRTLGSVAAEAGLTLRTAQRWVERYRKEGLASLARKERKDRGGETGNFEPDGSDY